MIEVLISIILLPIAVCAAVFTVALGVGLVKAYGKKGSKKV